MTKLFMAINSIYSIAWIACTGKDKNQYREESRVHDFLIEKAFKYAK